MISASPGAGWRSRFGALAILLGLLLVNAPARAQGALDTGSHVTFAAPTPTQVSNLATLARVWGFLKYHHPAITAGQRQWDRDLLQVMPAIIAARDRNQANTVLRAWIESLGPVPACNPCLPDPTGALNRRPDLTWIDDRAALGAPLSKLLHTIYTNRTGKQFYVSLTASGNPSFDHEPGYPQIAFPDSGFQLLALFRWWNIQQYWSPYSDGVDWDAVLRAFIPKLAKADGDTAYQLAVLEMLATAKDGHASPGKAIAVRPPAGRCAVPITVRLIEGKAVVTNTIADFRPGDVIDTLDGAPVPALLEQWGRYYAASNTASRDRDLAVYLTVGGCGLVSVTVTRDGQARTIAAMRTPFQPGVTSHEQPGETFRLLTPAIAYIKLTDLRAADLPGYFERAKNTKGLIVDLRGYPGDAVAYPLAAWLTTAPTPFASLTHADLANPGAFGFAQMLTIAPGAEHYDGQVFILVDETTQSAAEFTAMALRATPHARVVGSTTAGADGNISRLALPGAIATAISGLGIFHPDHRPTQRVGIVPDIVARPTIAGIAAGRDEVLETARRLLVQDSAR